MTLYELEQDAIDDLRQWQEEHPDEDEPHDAIFEIADNHVPIYTGDLLQLAADTITLATEEPELGPAFDGSPTPVNIIAANVFAHIEQVLWEAWDEISTRVREANDD